MTLFGTMGASVAGLRAHTQKMGSISDNIANVDTTGYKAVQTSFTSMVTAMDSQRGTQAPGGSLAKTVQNLGVQGMIKSTQSDLDLAVDGKGFFLVRTAAGQEAPVGCTRVGSFHPDREGHLVNEAGFYLQGWKYAEEGTDLIGGGTVGEAESV
ncbi:MAG: flagellar hook-basal body complex protein, partial [Holosporales bacterium]|nr:flagellar hook-basal body complex protein [Holosporales bacterium]